MKNTNTRMENPTFFRIINENISLIEQTFHFLSQNNSSSPWLDQMFLPLYRSPVEVILCKMTKSSLERASIKALSCCWPKEHFVFAEHRCFFFVSQKDRKYQLYALILHSHTSLQEHYLYCHFFRALFFFFMI